MTSEARCRICDRAIIWSTSPNGARLPLDARPVTAYRILTDTEPPDAVAVQALAEPDAKLYVSHFLTCPQAAQHSRGRA